jgi:hypothetical protein
MRTTPLDPDGWPIGPHTPQHAAAQFRLGSPATAHAHRALRLFVSAGVWGAGLCLVIGLLVLVISAASPGPVGRLSAASADTATHGTQARDRGHDRKSGRLVASTSGKHQAHPPASGGRGARPGIARDPRGGHDAHATGEPGRPAPRRVVVSFAGHGGTTTREFSLRTGARWQIYWSYSCPPSLPAGLLVMQDALPGGIGAAISEAGTSGQGDTWLSPDGQNHRLIVISTCSWTLKVMQNS